MKMVTGIAIAAATALAVLVLVQNTVGVSALKFTK
jgi:hypothetical protein